LGEPTYGLPRRLNSTRRTAADGLLELEQIGPLETHRRFRGSERAQLAVPGAFDRPDNRRIVFVRDRANDGDAEIADHVEHVLQVVSHVVPEEIDAR
jgi:hypothetical protein